MVKEGSPHQDEIPDANMQYGVPEVPEILKEEHLRMDEHMEDFIEEDHLMPQVGGNLDGTVSTLNQAAHSLEIKQAVREGTTATRTSNVAHGERMVNQLLTCNPLNVFFPPGSDGLPPQHPMTKPSKRKGMRGAGQVKGGDTGIGVTHTGAILQQVE